MDASERTPSRGEGPGLFWPILLIGIGVLILLSNLGLLPANYWAVVWQLWPLLLIALGLQVLLGRRTGLGRALGAMLALALLAILGGAAVVVENDATLLGEPRLGTHHVSHPLAGAQTAEVRIDFPGGNGRVFALDATAEALIEGDLTTYGTLRDDYSADRGVARVSLSRQFSFPGPGLFDGGGESWELGLNPNVSYDLTLDAGSGSYDFDLRGLALSSLDIDTGSGATMVTLPEEGQYRFDLDAGSGAVEVAVPEGVAVRVEYDAGSGGLDAPGLQQVSGEGRDGVFESPGYSQSGPYVVIDVDGGSGAVRIR